MLMAEATDNSSHFVIFESDTENNAKLKPFRRLHAFDGDPFLRKHFWRVINRKIAEQLGITCKFHNNARIRGYLHVPPREHIQPTEQAISSNRWVLF